MFLTLQFGETTCTQRGGTSAPMTESACLTSDEMMYQALSLPRRRRLVETRPHAAQNWLEAWRGSDIREICEVNVLPATCRRKFDWYYSTVGSAETKGNGAWRVHSSRRFSHRPWRLSSRCSRQPRRVRRNSIRT